MTAAEKYDALLARICDLGSVLVAYSGGVDSTLLAFAAHAELGENAAAILASSATYPEAEIAGARKLSAQLGFRLLEVGLHRGQLLLVVVRGCLGLLQVGVRGVVLFHRRFHLGVQSVDLLTQSVGLGLGRVDGGSLRPGDTCYHQGHDCTS